MDPSTLLSLLKSIDDSLTTLIIILLILAIFYLTDGVLKWWS